MAIADGATALLEEGRVPEEDATLEDDSMPEESVVADVEATPEDGARLEEGLRVKATVTKPVDAPVPVG